MKSLLSILCVLAVASLASACDYGVRQAQFAVPYLTYAPVVQAAPAMAYAPVQQQVQQTVTTQTVAASPVVQQQVYAAPVLAAPAVGYSVGYAVVRQRAVVHHHHAARAVVFRQRGFAAHSVGASVRVRSAGVNVIVEQPRRGPVRRLLGKILGR